MMSFFRPARILLGALLLMLSGLSFASPAPLAINTWTGSGNWSSTGNWSLGTVPGPGDVATFTAANGNPCTIDVAVNVQGIDIAGYTGTITSEIQTGLWGDFFDGEQFNTYTSSFLDPTVDFNPADVPIGTTRAGGPDTFTARWRGQVLTTGAGVYTFSTTTDDGSRLWVNGVQVINDWTLKGPTLRTSPAITLAAATWYDIQLEMFERGGGAAIQLQWTPPAGALAIIPSGNLRSSPPIRIGLGSVGLSGEYYQNVTTGASPPPPPGSPAGPPTGGTLVITRFDTTVNFPDFNAAGVRPGGVNANDFMVLWTGQFLSDFSETYTIRATTDDGVRVWVNGTLVVNFWNDTGMALRTGTIGLSAGNWNDIRMEYYQNQGGAGAILEWESPSVPIAVIPSDHLRDPASIVGGLRGEYFNNPDTGPSPPPPPTSPLAPPSGGTLILTRTDPIVDFNWGGGAPAPGVAVDDFMIHWSGEVLADTAGAYTFIVRTDDGGRLWIDGTLIVNSWIDQGMTDRTGVVALTAGWHSIIMEQYENGGGAGAQLRYIPPGGVDEVIPFDHLRPVVPVGVVGFRQTSGTFTSNLSYIDMVGTFNVTAGTFNKIAGVVQVVGALTQSGGTVTAGTGLWDVSGAFSLSGGTYSAPTSTLEVGGSFTHSAGTFTSNAGTVALNSSGNQTVTVSGTTFGTLAVSDGIVGHWKFDEAAGAVVSLDSSGYANHGAHIPVPGGPTVIAPVPGLNYTNPQARNFDGVDDFLSVPYDLNQWLGGTGSVSVWVRTTQIGAGNYWEWPGITGTENAGDINDFFWGTIDDLGGIGVQSGNGARAGSLAPINDGLWHHVAFTRSASSGVMECYVDGVFQTTATGETGRKTTSFSSIGRVEDTGNSPVYYQGDLDDLRIYNRILTAQEVQAMAIGNQPAISTPTYTQAVGALTISGNMLLNGGTYNAGGQNITLAGSWLNQGGVYVAGTGTVTMTGASSRVILSGGQRFNDLTLAAAGPFALNDRLRVADALALTTGATLNVTDSLGTVYVAHAGTVTQAAGTTFNTATGTVVLDSSVNQTFNFLAPVNNLRIEDPSELNLVAYWKFDEGNGIIARDSSGANNGTLTNAPSWNDANRAPVPFDNAHALFFDGSNDHVGVPSFGAFTSFSVSSWIYATGNTGSRESIVSYKEGNGVNMGFVLCLNEDSFNAYPRIWVQVAGSWQFVEQAVSVALNTWVHLAATYDGTNLNLYRNGVQVATGVFAGGMTNSGAQTTGIGSRASLDTNFFPGGIDDVRIYDAALTAAQVSNLALGGYRDGTQGTATFTSGGNLTVNGAFTIDSGVYNSGTFNTTLPNPFTLLGGNGAYVAGSGTQSLNGLLSSLTISGGSYTSGSGPTNLAGNLVTNGGALTVGSGVIDVTGSMTLSGGTLTFNSAAGNLRINQNMTVSGTPTVVAPVGTLTMDGSTNQTLTSIASATFFNVVVANTGAVGSNIVTLAGPLNASGTVTVQTGILEQGNGNIVVGGIVVNSGAMFRNVSAGDSGDITLGAGGVVNNGAFLLNGGGPLCGGADTLLIRSTVAGTQRAWTGTGFFRLIDINLMDQTTALGLTAYESTNAGNNVGFTISAVCPLFGITITPNATPLVTTEAGGTDFFTAVLTEQPLTDVTITIVSSDITEGTVSTALLTFTPVNWNVAQAVTATGVNDFVDDGDIAYVIQTGNTVSSDPDYNARVVADVAALNTDDDTAGVTVTPVGGLITAEWGRTDTFTVVLTSEPTANVTIGIASSNIAEGTVSAASASFTPALGSWNVPVTITVTGVADGLPDGNQNYFIFTLPDTTTTDALYVNLNPADVRVTNVDNSSPGITVVPQGGIWTTESGGTATFRVLLNQAPTGDVTVPLSSTAPAEGVVTTPAIGSLTFTTANWDQPQPVIVTGQDDAPTVVGDNVTYLVLTLAATGPGLYSGMDGPDVTLVNLDNDARGVAVVPASVPLVTTESGGSDVFFVVLNPFVPPASNVTLTLASSDPTEGAVSPALLTFTPANWSTAQMVVVTGVDDQIDDGDIAYSITTGATVSADGPYNGLGVFDPAAINIDNDTSGFTVIPLSNPLVTSESGTASSFTIQLNTLPTANVVITFTSNNTGEGTVSPLSVTFTPVNGLNAQTVTVTGVNDAPPVIDGSVGYTIFTNPDTTTADLPYRNLDPADVSALNIDNDVAGATVIPTSGLFTSEDGISASFTIRLNTIPTADVTIGLSSSNTAEGVVAPVSVTFTPGNALTPQTIVVTGVDDPFLDGLVTYAAVTAPAASADGNYSALDAADVTVGNRDNDGVVISESNGGTVVSEAGQTDTYTVVLGAAPTTSVIVTITTDGQVTTSTTTLTFTPLNFATPQTVTVRAVDDFAVEGNPHPGRITHTVFSSDPNYNGISAQGVVASITENDLVDHEEPGHCLASASGGGVPLPGAAVAVLLALLLAWRRPVRG